MLTDQREVYLIATGFDKDVVGQHSVVAGPMETFWPDNVGKRDCCRRFFLHATLLTNTPFVPGSKQASSSRPAVQHGCYILFRHIASNVTS